MAKIKSNKFDERFKNFKEEKSEVDLEAEAEREANIVRKNTFTRKTEDISQLKPNPLNMANMHRDEEYLELLAGVKASGTVDDIEVKKADENGIYDIIGGHRRFMAATEAGLTRVPIKINTKEMTKAEEIAAIGKSNAGHRQKYPYDIAWTVKLYYEAKKEEDPTLSHEEVKKSAKKALLIAADSSMRNYDYLAALPDEILAFGRDFYITRDEGISLSRALQDAKRANLAQETIRLLCEVELEGKEDKDITAAMHSIMKDFDKKNARKDYDATRYEEKTKTVKADAFVKKINKQFAKIEEFELPKQQKKKEALAMQIDEAMQALEKLKAQLND